jgi:hypothetical protein
VGEIIGFGVDDDGVAVAAVVGSIGSPDGVAVGFPWVQEAMSNKSRSKMFILRIIGTKPPISSYPRSIFNPYSTTATLPYRYDVNA